MSSEPFWSAAHRNSYGSVKCSSSLKKFEARNSGRTKTLMRLHLETRHETGRPPSLRILMGKRQNPRNTVRANICLKSFGLRFTGSLVQVALFPEANLHICHCSQ